MSKTSPRLQSTSLTLDADLLDEACRLGIDISRAAESGVLAAVKAERARVWREENADAIASYDSMVEQEGVPLAQYRKF